MDGADLPAFVVAEFRKFLRCGVLAHGFARAYQAFSAGTFGIG